MIGVDKQDRGESLTCTFKDVLHLQFIAHVERGVCIPPFSFRIHVRWWRIGQTFHWRVGNEHDQRTGICAFEWLMDHTILRREYSRYYVADEVCVDESSQRMYWHLGHHISIDHLPTILSLVSGEP